MVSSLCVTLRDPESRKRSRILQGKPSHLTGGWGGGKLRTERLSDLPQVTRLQGHNWPFPLQIGALLGRRRALAGDTLVR